MPATLDGCMVTQALDTIWQVTRIQTLVQLNEKLLQRLDERAANEGRSRSALIRDAIEEYLYDEEQARIDREIREGYERIPVTEEEMRWAEADLRELIREEPW